MLRLTIAAVLLLSVSACVGTVVREPAIPAPIARKTDAPAILAAADATREEGRYTEAMQIYQQVLVADPTQTTAQLGIAECLLALGKPGDARQMFDALSTSEVAAVALQGKGLSLL